MIQWLAVVTIKYQEQQHVHDIIYIIMKKKYKEAYSAPVSGKPKAVRSEHRILQNLILKK